MGVEHWSNDTNGRKRRYSGGKPVPLWQWDRFSSDFGHHKQHTD